MTEAFTDITHEFEAEYPDTNVELNFAGSGTLRMQIESGAPVNVFASASESDMELLYEKSLIENDSRKDFAANTLVMVVPDKNGSESPKSLEDLTAGSIEKNRNRRP
ncbi:molybdate ABC transporter substrate-binding protein [Methanosarcina horonobensis]|uniref:molybdate ABC transporter substrate-binding protein n=1 Tax=Methanosarcina horonobensis TaxID=418008 RepID=UPI002FCE01FD